MQPDIWTEPVDATRDEVRQFLRFYVKTQIGPAVLTFGRHDDVNRRRLGMVNRCLTAWRMITGPRDKNGRFKFGVRCIAWTECDVPRGHLCWNITKDPSALCHVHNKPSARTLWNFDPFLDEEATASYREAISAIESAQQAEWQVQENARVAEEQRQREADNAAWEAKWRPVAARIRHNATERQIFYLLELGAKPSELEGIDKRRASEMIDRLNDEEYERRGWTD
ncbi:MAG: hypothetical protein WD894_04510 [Pirellulales bacterium]